MNYFKAAEQLLSSVPAMRRALENLERREKRLLSRGKPKDSGAIAYDKPFADMHYISDALGELLELSECERNITRTKAELYEIERVLRQLPEEQQKVLTLWYIEKCTKESIMEDLHISSMTSLYNLRNRAVAEFALHYYGASALPSI